jgi:hypothetical protein
MSNKRKKSVTQRIKDTLNSGKAVSERQVVNVFGGSPKFLGKRVAELRKNGDNIVTTKNRSGETVYKMAFAV